MCRFTRHFCFFCFVVCAFCEHESAFSLIQAISTIPLIGKAAEVLKSEEKIELEEVMFSISDDMNQKGAIKLHIVIVFDKELIGELKRLSSKQYFRDAEQFKKDNPDKLKIFQWQLVAKKRVTKWIKVPYESDFMPVEGGFIFAKYDTVGEHRALIPKACKKLKIMFERDDFRIKQADEPTDDAAENEEDDDSESEEDDDKKDNPFSKLSENSKSKNDNSKSSSQSELKGALSDLGSQFKPEELKQSSEENSNSLPKELDQNMQWK